MRLIAYCDGGGKWKERHANIGVYILDADTQEVLVEEGHDIGDATNNEAEYSAVAMALYHANNMEADSIDIYCDSRLIVNQLNGDWRTHENHLLHYYNEVKEEAEKLDFTISWIPRSLNKRADALSRGAVENEHPPR